MKQKKILYSALGAIVLIIGVVYYLCFSSLNGGRDAVAVNIYPKDNIDSVTAKIKKATGKEDLRGFGMLASMLGYKDHIRTGHYAIPPGMGALRLLRHLRSGMQTPVELTIPSVRTTDRLAAELSKRLMLDSTAILTALQDPTLCAKYDCDTATITTLFIPNTYEIYWDVTVTKLLDRMKKESDAFWTTSRLAKARSAGLTPKEVITLASIIEEETANDAEKPKVAGMYLNRLKTGMPLQADPTIKYALRRFDLKRIYTNHTFVRSPYNTYRNEGLPPGPIRIPSVKSIDAVLNYDHNDYLYMCAKPDFSGTHNFAHTYAEHQKNAALYSAALNKHGIQ